MPDPMIGIPPRGSDPAGTSFAITPSDTVDLATSTRGILVSVGGPVAVLLKDDSGSARVLTLAAGMVHPLCVRRVFATGTTATGIFGFY